jgi:hypothetical protein
MQWPDPAKIPDPANIKETDMNKTTPEQNKALVLEAFDTLFNKRDYAAAERFWSDRYIQRSAHIAPGREGLFDLIRTAPATLRYESGRRKQPNHAPSSGSASRASTLNEEATVQPRRLACRASSSLRKPGGRMSSNSSKRKFPLPTRVKFASRSRPSASTAPSQCAAMTSTLNR